MTVQTHNFEADTGKILNIVINSLYSDRDIFLRELLSNASDAIHKKKFLKLSRILKQTKYHHIVYLKVDLSFTIKYS